MAGLGQSGNERPQDYRFDREPFLERADLLVWLDLTWEVCHAALVERQRGRGEPTPASEMSFAELVYYSRDYHVRTNSVSHQGHQRLFEQFAGEKHRLNSRQAVEAFLARFTGGVS